MQKNKKTKPETLFATFILIIYKSIFNKRRTGFRAVRIFGVLSGKCWLHLDTEHNTDGTPERCRAFRKETRQLGVVFHKIKSDQAFPLEMKA